LATQAETATATATQSAVANLLAAIAEISAASDSLIGGRVFPVAITEAAAGVDAVITTVNFLGSIQELATGLDAYSAVKSANVYPEGIQLNVYVGQVLVWGTIPTEQTPPAPDWTDIPT
jgi:hypothetical protein